jgi:PTS system nitrogen regulatory IIA component
MTPNASVSSTADMALNASGAPGIGGCANLITSDCVIANLRAANKKQILQELARKAATLTGQSETAIYDVLDEREKLGTTGIGHGIAIPHGKLPGLDRVYGVFARLERPVDFDAIDDQPVDLIFLLLGPANCGGDHLKALAKVSRLLRDRLLCEKVRGSTNCDAIYALMNETEALNAA